MVFRALLIVRIEKIKQHLQYCPSLSRKVNLILHGYRLDQLGQVLLEPLGVALVRLGDLLEEGLLRFVQHYHRGLQQSTNLQDKASPHEL